MEYRQTTSRFVAILNKKYPMTRLMNALGHMAVGLTSQFKNLEILRFQDYIDKDGTHHPTISDNPFIILKADNSNQIRTLRNNLVGNKILYTDFLDTMIEGTYFDQHERTLGKNENELEYIGICFFADNQLSRSLTKKFSLFN